ncbi:uncharacterized protein [Aegilops tauschii subsp. strangulata]|uniref:Speckle-type POZ protein-like protein B n=1 Tax=Aegilops tauschii TaxID=37682 RepID=N1R5C1_AEGTA|nr:uncharacterized protein LOC123161827 [Triticum aestivum]
MRKGSNTVRIIGLVWLLPSLTLNSVLSVRGDKVAATTIEGSGSAAGYQIETNNRAALLNSATHKLWDYTVPPIDSGAASGYHLLVVEGFSRTRDILPAGEYIRCRTFLVGGHRWHLTYYTNGYDSEDAGFVSLVLVLEEDDDCDEDENDDDWEANEDDQTDNDDDDEDDDYEDEDKDGYHQDEHADNDDAHDDDMAEDDDEDEDHEDEHINNDDALHDDMAEDDDHDYHELFPSVKAQVFLCFIDQFQWLHSGRMRETKFGLITELTCKGFRKREILERSAHLKDDSFTIRCDIVVLDAKADIKSKQGASTMAPPFIQVPPSDMPIHFKNLLLSEEGADVTFVVGSETFAAHDCVLAARSTAFKSQLFGDKLGTAIVKIDDIEAEVFEGMLTFIYT